MGHLSLCHGSLSGPSLTFLFPYIILGGAWDGVSKRARRHMAVESERVHQTGAPGPLPILAEGWVGCLWEAELEPGPPEPPSMRAKPANVKEGVDRLLGGVTFSPAHPCQKCGTASGRAQQAPEDALAANGFPLVSIIPMFRE